MSELEYRKVNIDENNASNGLVVLVLSLVNTIRELMEKQALRKIESGQLTDEKIEKIGITFLALEEKMNELKTHFNLTDKDLEIDLNQYLKVIE